MAVTASFLTDTLSVLGDNNDNTIEASRNAAGTILVNGGAVAVQGGTPTVANTALIQVFGLGQNDTISLDESNGALPAANLFGGAGNDTLVGGSGGDQLFGQADNDTLLGKGGTDFLFGGDGNDTLTGGDADDQVFGEAGNDRMIWNPGDDTDLFEGGADEDTAEVNGGNGAETFTVTANGARVRFDRVTPAPFFLDIGTTEHLVVNMNGGDDSFSATGNLAALISVTVDGGSGNDTILGSNGNDTLLGGDGDDFIDGQQGNDTVLLGAGNDVFQWDPGDGSDTIEGQDGTDTMLFNGSNGDEIFQVSANGGRVLFTRNLGNIVMDLDGVEIIDLNALGGADTVTVNDLSGTDLTEVNVNLQAVGGGGDGEADTVIVGGTQGNDIIDIVGAGTSLSVVGLSARVNVTGAEGANDSLVINGLGGNDAITATTLPAGVVKLTIDGGAGNDTILGSQGADTLLGGDGDDFLFGDSGNDTALMGAGNDVFQWNPGDGNDTIEGQDGTDTMLFFGANVSEKINILANGGRVLFTRDVANVTMDLDGTEIIDFRALGGADNIVVGDLSGTDVTQVSLDLRGPNGGGDGAADVITVNATQGDDVFGVAGDAGGISVFGLQAAVNIFFPEAVNDRLTLDGQGGNDVINASALEAGALQLTMNGGLGDDILIGSEGDDLINGGDGDDTALMGAGDDTFVWNPGDDNDTLEGQDGTDTMLFNGANIAEKTDISADGGRVRFSRDIANVLMDLNDVERIRFNALGGADNIVVNDLSGTDVAEIDIDLAGTLGGSAGDGQPDTVIIQGTNGNDTISLSLDAGGRLVINGLATQIVVENFDAGDIIKVNGLAGDDAIDASALGALAANLAFDGGGGNDILIGGVGVDTFAGGAGDDVLIGNGGADVLDGGPGDNIAIQDGPSAGAGGTVALFGTANADATTVSRNAAGAILANGTIVPGATVANTEVIQLFGKDGNDVLALDESNGALPRADLFGGDGNDIATGGSGNDQIFGGAGNDTLLGKGGFDFLFGGDGNDTLTGGDADDLLFGEAGDDHMIWNPGDDTDLFEGGAGTDTAEVNAGNGAETFTATANGSRVRFDRVTPAPFSLDIGTTENLVVNMNGGDDSFSATGNLAALIKLTVDGGAGNDTILGSNGQDLLIGGDGNDFIDGQQGNDTAFLGTGDDVFQWDPGDGNDTVEGQDGTDTLLFNGANIGEIFELSANGGRVLMTRNIANIVMDLNGVETLKLNALGGADTVTVNDLTGTDLTKVDVDLQANGAGDGQPDTVIVQGTSGSDTQIVVTGSGTSVSVTGLAAQVNVTGLEGANDTLTINGLGGNDVIDASALLAGIVKLTVDGGAGDEVIRGGGGADELRGGAGKDTFTGGAGNDFIDGGTDSDTAIFSGLRAQYTVAVLVNGDVQVTDLRAGAPDGVDILRNVETLVFADDQTVNHEPQIVSNGGGDTATVSIPENVTAVTTVVATDIDPGTTLSYSIVGGADAQRFVIDAATGALSFVTAPDFEAPTDQDGNNSYVVQVRASDGSLSDLQTITVQVTGVDEQVNQAPQIVSDGGDDSAIVFRPENGTAVTTVVATDVDPGTTLSYAIVGGADAQRFVIDAATGALSFVAAPDFEAPTDHDGNNSYVVQVGASDGSLSDLQAITVNVTDVSATIIGDNGDNVLVGTGENDVIKGLGGNDTAVFNVDFDAVKVVFEGNKIFIESAEGRDEVSGIENFQFTDGVIHLDDGNPLVNDLFYFANNKDVWDAGIDAEAHYNSFGFLEGRDPSALFSTRGYLSANADVRAAGINPLIHFDQFGWKEGRDPSIDFDIEQYLGHNPDLRASASAVRPPPDKGPLPGPEQPPAGVNPLAHFEQFGRDEGRETFAAIGKTINNGFDAEFYLLANPDVGSAGVDPFQHYSIFGFKEGRDPNAFFDTKGYLAAYADVAAAGVNPLEHYMTFGFKEGRDPSGDFDTNAYLAANPDVAAAGINPLEHFLRFGALEGRLPHGDGIFA